MSAVELFEFPETGQPLRAVIVDGDPQFVIADACRALGIGNTSMAADRLDSDDVSTAEVIDSMGRGQVVRVTSEAGLLDLIFMSRKPSARAFKRWVTHEVLPAIRKTGRYEIEQPAALDELEVARRYVAALEAKQALEARVAELAASAAAWDHLASGDGDWAVGDAAKILARDPAIRIGQGRLFKQLFEWGWTFRGGDSAWRVKQPQIECGRLSEIPQSHYHPRTGELVLDPPQVRIKPKGLVEIHKRLGGTAPLAMQLELPGGTR